MVLIRNVIKKRDIKLNKKTKTIIVVDIWLNSFNRLFKEVGIYSREIKKRGRGVECYRLLPPRQDNKQPDARVVPTPFKLQRVEHAPSRCGSFLNAFLDSVCTARGVLMRTKLVN